jgi:signal transduction histidine kinase
MEKSTGKEAIKIILFEDDNNVKNSVMEILTSEGYSVLHFESDVNLHKMLDDIKPDLNISDVMMPVKSGIEIIKEIKLINRFKEVPFIFLTARSDNSDLREGMNLGADDFIVKPFKAKDLLRSVELRIKKSGLYKEKIDRFSKSVALSVPHELRTPLISLVGYSDLIIDDFDFLSDNDIREYVKRIKLSAARLHKVIEKFILYSNLLMIDLDEELKLRFLAKTEFDFSELLSRTAVSTSSEYNRYSDLSIEADSVTASLSEELLSYALIQIIDNAFKFSSSGTPVIVKGTSTKSGYEISIGDNGRGISSEQRKEIEAFHQFEREKLNQSGSGLGLAITNKALSFLGSKLSIESDLNKGTVCKFVIST